MVTGRRVPALAMSLPRTREHLNRHQVKVPVGRIVYAAISPHETIMGRRSGLRRPAFGATPITRASSRTVSHMVRP